jgi:hypothetical protein
MAPSKRFPRVFALGMVLILSTSVGIAGAAQAAAASPIQIVPADALFCLRVNKLNTALGQTDQFLTGVSPVGVSMPVRAKLGQLLGGPEPNGINMAGDFAAFGPLPGGEAPNLKRIGVLIPLSDYQQFLTNPNVTKPDAQGISRIGAQGKQAIAATRVGNYMLLTGAETQNGLLEMKKLVAAGGTTSLAQRLGPDELKRSDEAPLWAYANIQIVAKTFGPQIQEKLKAAQKSLQEQQAKGAPVFGQPAAILDMYGTILNSLMQETQFVSLTLHPSPNEVRTALVVAAVPNTEMAKILSLGRIEGQPNLMAYLRNGAIANFDAMLNPAFARAVTLKYVDVLAALLGQTAAKEDIAKLKQLALDSTDALGGSLALSYLPALKSKPPFEVMYVATLKDKQKFNQVLEQAPALFNQGAIADLYRELGLKMQFSLKRGAETYKGIPIDVIHFAIQPVDVNTPQGQMLKSMYGEGFDLRLAIVNNLVVYTLAQDPDKAIHTLIDEALAGGPSQVPTEIQAALVLLPDAKTSQFFGTFNVLRMLQVAMTMMPMAGPPPAEVPTQSNVAFASQIGSGRLRAETVVPKQHVLEVMAVFMQMQQQKMQEQQQQKQGAQPAQPQGKPPAKPERKQL